MRKRSGAASLLALTVALGLGVSLAPAAQAGTTIPRLPQTNAADWTPRVVDDGTRTDAGVYELRQIGNTMYAGGDFTSVQNATGTVTYPRTRLFSFDATTGAVSAWAPNVNGQVWAMEPSPDGRYLYIGGEFTRFTGRAVNRLVKYDLLNQRVDTAFNFPTSIRKVTDLQLVGNRLVVAGTFPGGIVGVNPTTGAPDDYFRNTQATGQEQGYNTQVYRFSVNPAGTRMVILGSFTAIGGQPRQQAAMLTLGSTSASVSGWYSTRWNEDCSTTLRHYTRDVDWSVDGNNFAIVTTGGPAPNSRRLCDTVTWWRNTDSANQEPVWINYSGGDTFHSVAVTNQAVFVSGHFRWLDNPQGRDTPGPGSVSRQGLGAISPTTGRALSWNPTKSIEGGRGGYDLYFTGAGLWIGHFEQRLTRELHPGLGLLPY
ncbi:hypothetical protein [Nocardioides caldifontis]|uniref:hypothetical protein n=1 Tax=Nocardioides caldifontis TaxID=2588938 RepID=UPI0011DF726A|nr:hypothetical protein [Nocardioides caldifontis]